jgi:hypothetical protein
MTIEVGKTYKTITGAEFKVLYIGEQSAFGISSKYGETIINKAALKEEVKPKRTITCWVNIYEHTFHPNKLRIGGNDYETFEDANSIGKSERSYVDTISITYTEK